AGATDIVNWTDNGTSSFITRTGLSLATNQNYYFNVQSQNGAGLLSTVTSSDAQMVVLATGVTESENPEGWSAYPNPFSEDVTIAYTLTTDALVEISLIDVLGKQISVYSGRTSAGSHQIIISKSEMNLSKGMYMLKVSAGEKFSFIKLMLK
ncbi:MAG: T9SS type A sorting domain-containing protein, partial [Bacteroidota bacterium]|nr:T9SS type A sorting domain-containing protein [Bacteroidota bacterium]